MNLLCVQGLPGYVCVALVLVIKSGNWKYTNKRECFFPSKNGNEGVGTRGKKQTRRKNRVKRLVFVCVGEKNIH